MVHTDPATENLVTDKGSIETTPNHPFFTTDRGWVQAGSLKVGEKVRTESGGSATVVSFTVDQHPASMWDLTVDTAHSFFVGSGAVLVHNCWDGSEPVNSTGRWYPDPSIPNEEKLLDKVFDNPLSGDQLLVPDEFDDPVLQGGGWVKYSMQLGSSVIHYNVNTVTGQIDDWKFMTGN
jgi:hypothetical protein